ncbi:MAG: hypothetical protein KDK70_09040 [Myxococcales bacterium]|nr:hypothetical protein [Myxococcales bacterium]
MTTSRTPAALALALAGLGAFGISCTAILAPRDDVQRCGTADDCEPTGDNRYVPVCRFDDPTLDADEFDKICVADFKPSVGCNPMNYTTKQGSSEPHPFREAFDRLADAARYVQCDPMTQLGTMGCPPAGSACNEGLAVNDVGLCDDTDPSTPKAYQISDVDLPGSVEDPFGHEVRDQFCRSYFCDDRFVCDLDTNFCVVCDDSETYGRGGCGQIYTGGARSCAYEDGGACKGADVNDETITIGACM